VYYTECDSPIGRLRLAGDGHALTVLDLPSGRSMRRPDPAWKRDATPFAEALRQLRAYFAGDLHSFSLALAPAGTLFQRRVWDALLEIPYGATASYRDIAIAIGQPSAVRAVGLANGRNPIPIVIPCHRVIGSDGSLTGYGGGLDVKRFLLELERRA
jgi:methylated-DNA-[protein]-cysteine S-methyltransferase